MGADGKMLGKQKHFSRCHIHGNNPCEVTLEIQANSIGRATEKRSWKKEIKSEINFYKDENK
jgi:hypothetical protein